eukprot:2283130-Amphidinium_carterae.1
MIHACQDAEPMPLIGVNSESLPTALSQVQLGHVSEELNKFCMMAALGSCLVYVTLCRDLPETCDVQHVGWAVSTGSPTRPSFCWRGKRTFGHRLIDTGCSCA